MKRIAILGGGVAGVSAAYELALQQREGKAIEFVLFEAASRLGGTVETVHRNGFVIECGPDSWVTEKPWARDLAVELGLENELIQSQDDRRKTYLAKGNTLTAMPDGMRMMVPMQWDSLLQSPLFSPQAKLAYQREPELAEQLKESALDALDSICDESVRDFVIRHFGTEVADTIAAPLLAGVFGGDIATLSARAVLPSLVTLERQYGSLILGLQQRRKAENSATAIFTTLRHGLAGLIEQMEVRISRKNVRGGVAIGSIERTEGGWTLGGASLREASHLSAQTFDAVLVATPARAAAKLLAPHDKQIAELLPQRFSSSIVVALAFSAVQARAMHIPRGFGFLVSHAGPLPDCAPHPLEGGLEVVAQQALLACTFVDQKFPYRAPEGAVLLRAFFGGPAAAQLLQEEDDGLIRLAHTALGHILGKLPEPMMALVRRWPESLPLYSVGHLDRIEELELRISKLPHLCLIGNAYRGVGIPDVIHAARTATRELVAGLADA